ncbi:MAG: hypothetical protein A3F73_02975 [Gallionellales bacterium RIFCSPLOWO2_12_FULL_59_22]|nr:MAG: hypothetical protein A3H99_06700 [Gallionellales bacterium RIFCSPLOWO2_02_FULL_59_110]OGT02905.1 MAG: hypothetical protein A2Z65_03215 [Gallionellales bacterium RIFCSPLOWO2_02_58_13]OGT13094.1 MAG: hypothetical protein A3F73_02975 [Gallionellales bacterium RIFCSPLOWO2_12_FULL_59_22]
MYKWPALTSAVLLVWLTGSGIALAEDNPPPSGQTVADNSTGQTIRTDAVEKLLAPNDKTGRNASRPPARQTAFRFLDEKNLGLGCSKGE